MPDWGPELFHTQTMRQISDTRRKGMRQSGQEIITHIVRTQSYTGVRGHADLMPSIGGGGGDIVGADDQIATAVF